MIKHQRTKTLRYWCTDMKHPYTNFTIYQSNRTMATYALIDELDIGVVTNFLPDDAARGIISPSSSSSASLGECSHMLLLRHLHEEWDPWRPPRHPGENEGGARERMDANRQSSGTQFTCCTCFTGTKVQILTLRRHQARAFGKNNKAYKASVDMDYKMYNHNNAPPPSLTLLLWEKKRASKKVALATS